MLLESLHRVAAADDLLLFLARSSELSHAAATLAAQGGFMRVLNIVDERDRYLQCSAGVAPRSLVARIGTSLLSLSRRLTLRPRAS
jgi:hypothetical protein